ncbi:hypothetical protein TSOC_011996, partial [Tetrabaena socialis]
EPFVGAARSEPLRPGGATGTWRVSVKPAAPAASDMQLSPKWLAALLVCGYLLGKLITFFVLYKGARVFWAWRAKRRAAAAGEEVDGPEDDPAAPLLGDEDVEDGEVVTEKAEHAAGEGVTVVAERGGEEGARQGTSRV